MTKKDVQYKSVRSGDLLVTRGQRFPDQIDQEITYTLALGVPTERFNQIVCYRDGDYDYGKVLDSINHHKGQLTFSVSDYGLKDMRVFPEGFFEEGVKVFPEGFFDLITPEIWDRKDFCGHAEVYDERILNSENPKLVKSVLNHAKKVLSELYRDPFHRTFLGEDRLSLIPGREYDFDGHRTINVSPVKKMLNSEEGYSKTLSQIEKLLVE
tara:strand:- start:44 stop:676 length:633 start_codon:yes stop_codon:yes gene_type:complete